ncbi:hypothetical protein QTP70_023175 [Hemibagrus guttatus]|uniref:histone deacetylase n=1 Tax=Hemibagrus guttatus TaxID=175788 RepID=A0AAE0UMJ6_9TELE|nr:hypothetical protein QTP70_023175 [Hemibagrus guttatus]
MPEPPQLPPFDAEEQRLYSELLLGDRAPYPISKGAPRHPTEEAHFGRLYPGPYPFGHDPELMTIGVGLVPLVPVKGTLNASAFQDILENFMLPTLWEQFGDDPFLFQHDCAPVHKARCSFPSLTLLEPSPGIHGDDMGSPEHPGLGSAGSMLQTIYESESRIPAEWLRNLLDTHSISSSVIGSDVRVDVCREKTSWLEYSIISFIYRYFKFVMCTTYQEQLSAANQKCLLSASGSELLSPVGRSEVSMPEWERDSDEWERQLQRELLLIQRQQQIQKQLLIAEFQKQHQALLRQHQAQLQEHIKLQQALLTLRQQQEALSEERTPEIEIDEEIEEVQGEELEHHRREQPQHSHLNHRKKERSKESPDLFPSGAMASTEVRQKLHDFLLNKSTKDTLASGHPLNQRAKLWYITSQHMSMEQKSPPLGETPPTFKSPLPSGLDTREEDFPLRKTDTASEPNLKVRSRLKQKVSERRSGPIQRRRDGSVLVTPPKKRPLELSDSSANDSSPSSGPSSPIGLCSNENGTSFQASSAQIEHQLACFATVNSELSSTDHMNHRWGKFVMLSFLFLLKDKYLPQGGILKADGSLALLNLYTSPSLPNLTLSLHSGPSPISPASSLKDRAGESSSVSASSREPKVNTSHQALLQHLLLKEQTRQQKILSSGNVSVLPQSPLVMKERSGGSSRPRLPRHRPLNRTQSAPLPQSTLAQLVLQQQHHNFVEKQKQYHQQVHINQVLSQSIEQLRNPTAHLEEDEEARAPELMLPPAGVIRSHSSSSSNIHLESSVQSETPSAPASVIRVKEEPLDPESRMEEGGRRGGVAGRRDERKERGEEPMTEVKSEQNVENMTETDV